jgi:hypothetical protein
VTVSLGSLHHELSSIRGPDTGFGVLVVLFRLFVCSQPFYPAFAFRCVRVCVQCLGDTHTTNSWISQAFLLFSIEFKYEIWTNLLKYSIYGNECAENLYPSKYSKYNEELPKNMQQLYIHHSLWLVVLQPVSNKILTNFGFFSWVSSCITL